KVRLRVRLVEQFDRVADTDMQARLFGALLYPGQTAGVARRDDGGAGGAEIGDLAVEQAAGQFRLGDVVDARAATTGIRLLQFDERDARYLLQKLARLLAYLLAVRQVAGVVVGDDGLQALRRGNEVDLSQPLTHVTHLRRERLRLIAVGRVVGQQVAILLHGRAAAR